VETLTKYLAVAGGGAAGAVLRYYISLSGLSRIAAPFPTATFVINITGSLIIGFFLTLVTERMPVNPHLRLTIVVGFVGAYTTFSTFEYETARLIEGKDFLYAFLYVVLSFVAGFAAVWGGIVAARGAEHVPLTSHAALYNQLDSQPERNDRARVEREEPVYPEPTMSVADKEKPQTDTGKRKRR